MDSFPALVSDELLRRQDRLFARRQNWPASAIPTALWPAFDFAFNRRINRALVYELTTARFVAQREEALLLGPPGTGKSHLAKPSAAPPFGRAIASFIVRPTRSIEDIADATLDGNRKEYLADLAAVPLLIIDDLGMRKLPDTAA